MQGKSLVMLLGVLYGGAFLAGFNENLVNMALMSIMADYGIDSIAAQWLVTGYMIVATVAVTCMAFLYRRFKLRTLFFSAAGLSFAGSLMGLFAPNYGFLLAARLVQAVGTGIFIPLMMNTVLAVTPKNKLGTYMSIGSCTITFGPAFAPVVCGGIVTAFGWHSVFVVPAVAMAALVVLGAFFVKNLETEDAHLDLFSVALSGAALFALSFGLAELTIDTLAALVSLFAAIVGFAVFVVRQLTCAHPLIDLSPARSIRFWPTLLLATVAMMSTFSMSVLLPLYFEGALATTAFFAGVVMLVPVLANTFVTLIAGRIMDKRGEWPLLPFGFAVVAAGFVVVAVSAPGLSIAAMLVGSIVTYVGVGLIFSPSQTAGLRTLPPDQHPFGVALSTTFVQIAACIGPSLYTGISPRSRTRPWQRRHPNDSPAPKASAPPWRWPQRLPASALSRRFSMRSPRRNGRHRNRRKTRRRATRRAAPLPPSCKTIRTSCAKTIPSHAPCRLSPTSASAACPSRMHAGGRRAFFPTATSCATWSNSTP